MYVARWRDRAFLCRYGAVNIFQLLGRDPIKEPLSALEESLFIQCLSDHVVTERKPFVEMGLPPPE